jgi:hypothetical protein
MPSDDITTSDIMEFLQEYMVTKKELDENLNERLRDVATKQDLSKLKLDILDAVDDKLGFLKVT